MVKKHFSGLTTYEMLSVLQIQKQSYKPPRRNVTYICKDTFPTMRQTRETVWNRHFLA